MPIAGKGMLLTSMDIDPAHEADFNRWYDREHLEERVAIPGFIEARRYVAEEGSPKYLCLYSTETIDVLDSDLYKARLAHPTEWSKTTMARFENMIRSVARITVSRGKGRGAVLGIIRLRPEPGNEAQLRGALAEAFEPTSLEGVISMHLIESDPGLSKPLAEKPTGAIPGINWFVLIDAIDIKSARAAVAGLIGVESGVVSRGIYRLLWDIAKADIS